MRKKDYFFQIKKLSKLCLVMAGLFISTGAFSQDVTSGLILHYNFDAISGTTVPDVSGNSNAGTLMGAAKDTAAYSNNGVKMGVKADYIALPSGFTSTLTLFTFTTWVKLDALKNATRFFDLGIGADATNNFLAFIPSYNGDNGFMCMRYRPVSGTAYNVISTTKCPTGVWAHIAVTYDWNGTSGKATMYLNGAVVGSAENLPYNPSLSLGATSNNILGVSRWGQDTNGFGGIMDDVRFYNRALTATDVLTLNGLAELNNQYAALTLGDISGVTTNLTLPSTLGTNGVKVRWATSNAALIDTLGTVTRPADYDATAKLTATLSQVVGDKTYSMTKVFTVRVLGLVGTPYKIAEWNFATSDIALSNDTLTVKDAQSGFVGKIINEARIRTIGTTTQFNVLDLGNGSGYFDMGKEIGKAIYSLNDYTMMGYFRIDADYPSINTNGNFYWTFSNTAAAMTDQTGYIIGSLKAMSQSISTNYYATGNQAVGANVNAALGSWHHFAYSQKENTGTVYVDGVAVATGPITNLPSTSITMAGRTGTLYNWLGRSNYTGDVYLRKAQLYGFQVLSAATTSDDLNIGIDGGDPVQVTIDALNAAYAENPDYTAPELTTEKENLSLGDLSAVTANLTLPKQGTLDPTVAISWKTTNSKLIDVNGIVTRPNYYNYPDTLTATLTKNGQSVTKVFPATVIVKDGTQFNNNLLVKYDFATVSDSIVTDAAEKHFTGVLKNNAKVHSIGTTIKYNVLSLGDSIGYFDMGAEVGKLMYNLTDYTTSVYFRVDTAYHQLANAGNFIWSFSNGTAQGTDQNGYIIGALNNQSVSITPKYYTAASGNQAVSFSSVALQGGWHNLTYTQSGTTGTLYIDGVSMASGTITNLPSTVLPKPNQLGTLYNWIGRSCFTSDAYLRKTLVYDFRLYKTALTDEQILTSVLNVGNTINALEVAYMENPTAVKSIIESPYKVVSTNGGIKIIGLTGTEKVSMFDIAGRQIKVADPALIKTNAGVYILKINNSIAKVIVK
ncbi:MAG: LamG domain-containing protein [Paludibacter sp.]